MLKKTLKRVRHIYAFAVGKLLLKFHYDEKYIAGSRFFKGGKFGTISAEGWEWIVESYRNCKRSGVNTTVPWPVSADLRIVGAENIIFHPDDWNNFQTFGCYYQAHGKITIGKGTYIAPNVGLITANHKVTDLNRHEPPKPIVLGESCWIGMNSVILPGVTLGDRTIVGAGAVVTKSFEKGNCVIAGNPAKVIRLLDSEPIDE